MDIPGEPAPWLHRHPSKQRLRGYYGPVRKRAPRLVLNAFGFRRWQAPSRDHHNLGRRFDARLLTFRARAADQAHAASTPDTTWPATRAPARLIPRGYQGPPVSMPSHAFRRLNSARPPRISPDQALLERLPGPHLTRSRRAFSLDAHHDSLQLTQLQGGLTPTPAGPTPEGQQASPGSRRESHPPAPTDPHVSLSTHTARAVQLSGRSAAISPMHEHLGVP